MDRKHADGVHFSFFRFILLSQAANSLRDNAAELARLQGAHLVPMRASATRLRKAAANLEERVRFNQSSLAVAIEMLIGQAEAAQIFLQDKGPEQLTKVNEMDPGSSAG